MDVNKVTLIGNIVRDPRGRQLPSGQVVSAFDLATNYSWRDVKTRERRKSTEYHSVVAWGKLAEIINAYLKKGGKVYVEGRLHKRSWPGRDGRTQNRTEVVADNLIMLGHRTAQAKDPTELPKDEMSVEEIPVAN